MPTTTGVPSPRSTTYCLVHGWADDVVPIEEGETLHAAAGAARIHGASFVVIDAGHRPTGDQLAVIVDTIAADLKSGVPSAAALPREIKLVPFGQDRPLNP